jgi:archaellum component FlaG (FlaF/FlaG flagellin family)
MTAKEILFVVAIVIAGHVAGIVALCEIYENSVETRIAEKVTKGE